MKQIHVQRVTTDKAMYDPGDNVHVRVDVVNRSDRMNTAAVHVQATHLGKPVGEALQQSFVIEAHHEKRLLIDWQAPDIDFKGYMLEVDVVDEAHNRLDSGTVGVDVSSSWTKFPRYGYVWDFTEDVDVEARIEKLKNYHLNALQYYDWKYRHHRPVPDQTDVWEDWSGRPIYGDTLRRYLSAAHKVNMVNMAYNMAYAAVSGYERDGVKEEWGLYFAEENERGEGRFTFKMADETPTGITHLYFFDMRNREWQAYIFEQIQRIFDVFEFDGWHSDTVGDWGKMVTPTDAEPFYVKDTYTQFLNAAKKAIGDKYLVFNPVGAQGIEQVNVSDVDVLYTEMWPWDTDRDGETYATYAALKKAIERARVESGGKSLVVPAYMSYDYGEQHPGRPFNTSAVLLTAAAVYAAGGSRIELGDNGNMLSNEYFPAQNLVMEDELQARIATYYDFIVAYENVLRDGQTETMNRVHIAHHAQSLNGEPNTIWAYTKEDAHYEIIHMINLLGVTNNDWRANDGKKETPQTVADIDVTYYDTNHVQDVWLASPDIDDGRAQLLPFTTGRDENGSYVTFRVPQLAYWNVIYMTRQGKTTERTPRHLVKERRGKE